MGFFDPKQAKLKIPPQVTAGLNFLQDLMDRQAPEFRPEQVAPLSPTEQRAQDLLAEFLEKPSFGEGFDEAQAEARRTVGGIDITKSQFFEPIISRAVEEGNLIANRLARSLQMQGVLGSTTGAKQLGFTARRTQQDILSTLAPFAEAERGRQFAAIPLSADLSRMRGQEPLTRVGAAAQFGGLPRQLSQAAMSSQFEAQRTGQFFPYTTLAPIASSLISGAAPFTTIQQPGATDLEKISMISNLILPLFGAPGGGTTKATAAPNPVALRGGYGAPGMVR